jgi:hypothetical protein
MSLLQDIQNKDLVSQRLNELGFHYDHVSQCIANTLKLKDNRYHYILSGFTTTVHYKSGVLLIRYPCGQREQFGVDDIVDLDLAISKIFKEMNNIAIELSNALGKSYFDVVWGCVKLQ